MHGMPIASIHVVAPSTRFNARKEKIIADALRRSTKELSYRLGFGKDDRNADSEKYGLKV